MRKYELTDETKSMCGLTAYRIKALKSFGIVKKGDIGGFISKEANLSHGGNAWVFDDAWVFGDAWVFDDAWVFGNAKVFGDARISGNARISGDAKVFGDARVFSNAKVFGDARVFGNANVSGNARVFGNARVTQNPVCLSGLKHHVTITDKHMSIGCEIKTFAEWQKTTPKQIEDTHGDGNLWKAWKPVLMKIIKQAHD